MKPNKVLQAIAVFIIMMAGIALAVLLTGCGPVSTDNYVSKYPREDVYNSPSGCTIGVDATCVQLTTVHYIVVFKVCDGNNSCQQQEREVNEATYNQYP